MTAMHGQELEGRLDACSVVCCCDMCCGGVVLLSRAAG
jgi:hypothetical protein